MVSRPVFLMMAAPSFALASCGDSDERQGVGGVTADEARALNEAASMLDRQADNGGAAIAVNATMPEGGQ